MYSFVPFHEDALPLQVITKCPGSVPPATPPSATTTASAAASQVIPAVQQHLSFPLSFNSDFIKTLTTNIPRPKRSAHPTESSPSRSASVPSYSENVAVVTDVISGLTYINEDVLECNNPGGSRSKHDLFTIKWAKQYVGNMLFNDTAISNFLETGEADRYFLANLFNVPPPDVRLRRCDARAGLFCDVGVDCFKQRTYISDDLQEECKGLFQFPDRFDVQDPSAEEDKGICSAFIQHGDHVKSLKSRILFKLGSSRTAFFSTTAESGKNNSKDAFKLHYLFSNILHIDTQQ